MTMWERPSGRSPLVIAHRGARVVTPENTLAAFTEAAAAGADGFELDVRLCATGEAVVIHDDSVDRTTDGTGAVADMTLAELRRLDAGAWFDERFAGERIPTLEEALEAAGRSLLVNVEIKGAAAGIARRVVDAVGRLAMEEWVLVSSFEPGPLLRVRSLMPALPIAFLYSSVAAYTSARPGLGRLHALHPRHDLVSAEMLADAHRSGYLVNAWTVNDPAAMVRLATLGVDGIIGDDPALVRRALGSEYRAPADHHRR